MPVKQYSSTMEKQPIGKKAGYRQAALANALALLLTVAITIISTWYLAQGLSIGGNGTVSFNGTIDEVRIFNRSLTSEEIDILTKANLEKLNATLFQFTANMTNLSVGAYTYQAQACDLAGSCNQTELRTLDVIYPTQLNINFSKFNGSTTNFTIEHDLNYVEGAVLEIISFGKIEFLEPINVSGADLDVVVNITENFISVAAVEVPGINVSAVLHLNVSVVEPRIEKDGVTCDPPFCNVLSHTAINVSFNVTGFSTYTVEEEISLGAFDDADPEIGKIGITAGDYVKFYANYSYTNATPFNDSAIHFCNVTFSDEGYAAEHVMVFNGTFYNFSRVVGTTFLEFNVSCIGGDRNLSVLDNITLENFVAANASPEEQGFGLPINVTATITSPSSVDNVTLQIIYPNSTAENVSMANISSTVLWSYLFTGWQNGTYRFTTFANDTLGYWYNDTATAQYHVENITLQIRTLKDTYGIGEMINLTDPPGSNIFTWTTRLG